MLFLEDQSDPTLNRVLSTVVSVLDHESITSPESTELPQQHLTNYAQEMEEFGQNLTLTLDVYLKYLQMFVTMIQSADSAALLTVSSSSTKSLLEEEWTFVKQVYSDRLKYMLQDW